MKTENRDIATRVHVLTQIKSALMEGESALVAALKEDLGKPWHEAWPSEIGIVYSEIDHIIKHLAAWMRPKKMPFCPLFFPGRSFTERHPFGTVLIISPWNYPAGLILSPLIGAIAAGNRVILKPSERAPKTEQVLSELFSQKWCRPYIELCTGSTEEVRKRIKIEADMVCFTGSTATGRVVMADAAQRPIPVLLELGGANPALVFSHADLKAAAERIAWGKFFNSGQTCVAPNHCYISADVAEEFTHLLQQTITEFYGDAPQESPHYGRMIDSRAVEEVQKRIQGAEIICGGDFSPSQKYIAPTLLRCDKESPLVQEEIFAPILPLISVENIENHVEELLAQNDSLALYGFGDTKKTKARLSAINTGSLVINGTLHRMASPRIPFGGVGKSGFGRYHGKAGFLAFSYEKTLVLKHKTREISGIYPPYTMSKKILKWIGKYM
ncbi:aldehyde dehydrogenase family protein [Chitinivibrio alkaliphilus]|uniref:Aldehyde dehydrogenase n=1 Tax=Chitinivibrio alkaliphilus ACht1 TaxID=1313304 RepID=U7D6T0_9BACT|nr:aldehyde dehydrogenase family protein [Chitinivibrio alkaliphilus]ERP38670.1 aldehyde dehydrogenase [Chitinivibrio alkaliphilus ACht1]